MEQCKDKYIKKNRNEEERKKWNELLTEARTKNNGRSEEDKETIFWKIVGDRVRKWYIKERTKTNESQKSQVRERT